MARHKAIALVVLAATLFSAVSPAFAASILRGQPGALRQMLGLPGEHPRGSESEDCHAEHHGKASRDAGESDEAPRHAAHGTYCSFCLNPNAVTGIAPAPVSVVLLHLAFDVATAAPAAAHVSRFVAHYRSRAPPASP